MEIIGTLLEIAVGHIILSTPQGRRRIPYRNVDVSYRGLALQELLRKRVKVTLWDRVTIEISSPNE